MSNPVSSRLYLNVPYAEKEDAKVLGARWCMRRKKWWVYANQMSPKHQRWLNVSSDSHVHDLFPADPHPVRTSPRTDFSLPDCACTTPPWEDCQHTTRGNQVVQICNT